MKIKNSNMKWYVLYHDFNTKKVTNYDVMCGIAEFVSIKIKKGEIHDLASLKEALRREFMYHYWSKAEFEMTVSGLSERDFANAEKIDIWRQLEPNLDIITEYVNIKCDLKLK